MRLSELRENPPRIPGWTQGLPGEIRQQEEEGSAGDVVGGFRADSELLVTWEVGR